VRQKAAQGNRDAQYGYGSLCLMSDVPDAVGAAAATATLSGAAPTFAVGLAHKCTFRSLTRPCSVHGHLNARKQ